MKKVLFASLAMLGIAFAAFASPMSTDGPVYELSVEQVLDDAIDLTLVAVGTVPAETPAQKAIVAISMLGPGTIEETSYFQSRGDIVARADISRGGAASPAVASWIDPGGEWQHT